MPSTTGAPLLAVVAAIEPVLREHAATAEAERDLPAAAHNAMRDAGLFRIFVPASLGGFGADLASGMEAIEEVSRIDSAAGWSLQIGATPVGIGALLPAAAAKEIYGDPLTVVTGAFFPPGTAVPAPGGFRLNGRWAWASGSRHATWVVNPALQMKDGAPEMMPDGRPVIRACFYPADQAQIVDTWHPLGMRGTGSHDVVASDVFIPEEHAAMFRPFSMGPNEYFAGPEALLGIMPTILGNAVVALGIARRAIDDCLEVIGTKTPAHFQAQPATRSTVQAHVGRAEATLSAARAYFYQSARNAWEAAEAGTIGIEERKHLQLAASYAAESAAHAVDYIHAAIGGNGVREEQHQFARHFRDVHTITQHALCSPTRFESMGQLMLGMETDWAFFNI